MRRRRAVNFAVIRCLDCCSRKWFKRNFDISLRSERHSHGVFETCLKPAGLRFHVVTVDPAEQAQACTSLDFNKAHRTGFGRRRTQLRAGICEESPFSLRPENMPPRVVVISSFGERGIGEGTLGGLGVIMAPGLLNNSSLPFQPPTSSAYRIPLGSPLVSGSKPALCGQADAVEHSFYQN